MSEPNKTNKEIIDENNAKLLELKEKADNLLPTSTVIDNATEAIIDINGEEV